MALAQYANLPSGKHKSHGVAAATPCKTNPEVAAMAGVNKATIQAIDTLEVVYSAVNGGPASVVDLRGICRSARPDRSRPNRL